jgi:hypothetical protein
VSFRSIFESVIDYLNLHHPNLGKEKNTMTFLKKLGMFLARATAIIAGISPIVIPFLGSKAGAIASTAVNDFTAIGQQVLQVEAVLQTPGSGAQKLAAAVPLVQGIIQTSELVAWHKIANEALFTEGCQDITNGTAKILNALSPDGVKSA